MYTVELSLFLDYARSSAAVPGQASTANAMRVLAQILRAHCDQSDATDNSWQS